MNYTVLIMGCFMIMMAAAWIFEGRKHFNPPLDNEAVFVVSDVIKGLEADEEAKSDKGTKVEVKY